jgi:hypothetical protein
VVEPPSGDRQRATRDLRDAAGNGPVIESTFEYRSDGVYLVVLKLTTTVLVFTDVQELRPPTPLLLLPTGATPGTHRELDVPGPAATARLELDVLRQEQVSIGGRTVETLVTKLTATLPGPQYRARLELTVWLAPTVGLWVKESSVAEATSPDGQVLFRSDYTATLQQLPS